MKQKKLDRINELARKAKTQSLSEEEKQEQVKLREEYLSLYRKNLRTQLDNIVLVDKSGKQISLKDRRKGKSILS